MKSEYNAPPNRERYIQRLIDMKQEVPPNATDQDLADITNMALCDQAACSVAIIDGKQRLLKFDQYWSAFTGLKWKYIPHSARGLMTEGEVRGVMKC